MGGRYRVVILEDEPHNREELLKLVHSRTELKLIAAVETGFEAETICKFELPDILIADIDVPLKNGVKVAEAVSTLGICCIFSTLITRYALEAFKLGAAGYLTKPYSLEDFNKVIDNAIFIIEGRRKNQTSDAQLKNKTLGFTEALKQEYNLTPAELEIAVMVINGCIRENLASELGKTERAVKSLLQSIYTKTVNIGPANKNIGRSDKYARLIYFLYRLEKTLNNSKFS